MIKKSAGKLIVSALIISLLVIPGTAAAKDKRGANLVVTRLDGSLVSGELIAVQKDSLLLLNNVGKDESIDLADVRSFRITPLANPTAGQKALRDSWLK